MDSWSEITRLGSSVTTTSISDPNNFGKDHNNQAGSQSSISTLLFDANQNVLWCGDSVGYTRSFTPMVNPQASPYQAPQFQLFPYTKFKVTSNQNPVLQHMNYKDGIVSLSNDTINFNNRRGLCKMSLTSESFDSDDASLFKNLTTMTYNCSSTNDIVVGTNLSLLKFDLNKSNTLTSFSHNGNIAILNTSSKFLTLGLANGSMELFDPVANQTMKTFHGHNGLISDLDVQGSYIATCGYSIRPRRSTNNEYILDPLVNIYDARMMKALPPIPIPMGATFVRFHPKLPNIVIIATKAGQIQFVDMYDQTNVYLYQADLSPHQSSSTYLANLEVSNNGDFLCFNDSFSNLHLWSFNSMNKDFVSFPSNLEQPDIRIPSQPIEANAPLNSIGMPYYKDLLLSNYASDLRFTKETAKLPRQIDYELLLELTRQSGFLPYDKLKYGPRNRVERYQALKELTFQHLNPKFLSEQDTTIAPVANHKDKDGEDNTIFQYKTQNINSIPNCYTKLQIQYSKFGVKDFDFNYYNKSEGKYCGLENHTENSYINSLIQVYRFSPTFYNSMTKNLLKEWLPNTFETIITNKNPQGSSIKIELGYLFDMMHKAKNKNVEIFNFSQVLNQNQEAKDASLINLDDTKDLTANELTSLINQFNKFLLQKVIDDESFMNIKYNVEVKGPCDYKSCYSGKQLSLDLVSPTTKAFVNKYTLLSNNPNPVPLKRNHTLITYLEYSIQKFSSTPCQEVHQQPLHPHYLETSITVTDLPQLLSINVNVSSEEFKLINSFKKWLVPEFYSVKTPGGKIAFKPIITQFNQNATKYELLGFVCQINHKSSDAEGVHHLVSYIYLDNQWYLFNDFLVMPIPEEEVFNLSYPWKKPIILLYQDQNIAKVPFEYFEPKTFSKLRNLDDTILYRDHFAGAIRETHKNEYELLTREEAPGIGTLVAIDAEFVTTKPEKLEVFYNGLKNLIRPKQLSLARISALRGDNGAKQGVAFIDDYIVHTQSIHDYLTNFSGIYPGDLDPIDSGKNLVTLQTAYRKLWLLLNLGVIFVGHGLYNDFRCINLQVPANQIKDTAVFYYKSNMKRQLSLKFLAYVLLKQNVQTGNHDSIEDAYTALLLYKKYLELTATGNFELTLSHIYQEGQLLRFKVPE